MLFVYFSTVLESILKSGLLPSALLAGENLVGIVGVGIVGVGIIAPTPSNAVFLNLLGFKSRLKTILWVCPGKLGIVHTLSQKHTFFYSEYQ